MKEVIQYTIKVPPLYYHLYSKSVGMAVPSLIQEEE